MASPLENVVMIMAGAMARDKTLATQLWALGLESPASTSIPGGLPIIPELKR